MAARTRSSSRGLGAPVGSASPTRRAKASADDSEVVESEKERLDRRATLATSWRLPFCSRVSTIAERVGSSKANRRGGASPASWMNSDTVEAPGGRRAADPSISTGSAGDGRLEVSAATRLAMKRVDLLSPVDPGRHWGTARAARGRRELLLVAEGRAAQDAGHGAAEATADVLAARRSAGRGRHTWQGVA